MEKWEIKFNGESVVLTDIYKVSDYERELRGRGIEYQTVYWMKKENKWVSIKN